MTPVLRLVPMPRSLTLEVEARICATWRTEWLRLCVGAAPADRPNAEAAISALYRDLGEAPPRFVWVDSPRSAAPAVPRIGHRYYGTGATGGSWTVSARLRSRLTIDLAPQTDVQLGHWLNVKDSYWSQSVGDYWSWNPFANFTRDIRKELVAQETSSGPEAIGWNHYSDVLEAGVSCTDIARFYACCRDVLGIRYAQTSSRRLDLWEETVRSCGWWWPNHGTCLVSERPTAMHRDAGGQLHHPSEAAFQFRDGFGLYRWHGTAVPPSWITAPDQLDPSVALTWVNIEQRRAAAEIIGWKRVLEGFRPLTIDKHEDPAIGELVEVELPEVGTARFLKVRCGTGREFVLSVPQQMRTARQANAWTYDLEPNQYQLEART